MENITRRGFVGTMGAMGVAAAAMGVPLVARADEAEEGAVEVGSAEAASTEEPWTAAANAEVEGVVFDPELTYADLSAEYTNQQLDDMIRDQTMVTEDYTFPSGKTIPALYINLRNKINRIGWGIGSGVEGNEEAWDFLMWLFSESDAEHYLEMPMYQQFTARDYSILSGRPEEECDEVLNGMADRFLIIRRYRTGRTYFELMNAEFGYWEWAIGHWNDEGYVATHETSNGTGNPQGASFSGDAVVGRTEPYNVIFPVSRDIVDGEMVPYTDWEAMVRSQTVMCTAPCACRTAGMKRGDRSNENIERFNVDTCWCAGDVAQMLIDAGIGHELTVEESIEKIKANIDAGVVTEGIWSKDQMLMCECDNEQCVVLNSYKAAGGEGTSIEVTALYDLNYDKEKCIQCGACIDRCNMGAISWGDDGYCEMSKLCLRCGQCAYICPARARSLTPKNEVIPLPEDDYIAKERRQARLRMASGLIYDFVGEESVQAAIDNGAIREDEVGHCDALAAAFEAAERAATGPVFDSNDPIEVENMLKANVAAGKDAYDGVTFASGNVGSR